MGKAPPTKLVWVLAAPFPVQFSVNVSGKIEDAQGACGRHG